MNFEELTRKAYQMCFFHTLGIYMAYKNEKKKPEWVKRWLKEQKKELGTKWGTKEHYEMWQKKSGNDWRQLARKTL